MVRFLAFSLTVLLSPAHVSSADEEENYEKFVLMELKKISSKLTTIIENEAGRTALAKIPKTGPYPSAHNKKQIELNSSTAGYKKPSCSLTLEKVRQPYRLTRYGVSIDEKVPLVLTIGSCEGIFIGFQKTLSANAESVNMLVGVNAMTKVYDCFNLRSKCFRSIPVKTVENEIWICGQSTTIWVKWTNRGFISLGKGSEPGTNTVVEYQGSREVNEIKYISLFSNTESNVPVTVQPIV